MIVKWNEMKNFVDKQIAKKTKKSEEKKMRKIDKISFYTWTNQKK